MSKTVDDLRRVTGLTRAAAEACFAAAAGGGYAAALASFAQSYAQLRDDDFDSRDVVAANATAINAALRDYYARARALKQSRALSDAAAWQALNTSSSSDDDSKAATTTDKHEDGSSATTSGEKTAKAHEAWAKAFEYILPRSADDATTTTATATATTTPAAPAAAAASPFASVFSFGPAATTTTTTRDSKPAAASFFGFGAAPPPPSTTTATRSGATASTTPASFSFAAAAPSAATTTTSARTSSAPAAAAAAAASNKTTTSTTQPPAPRYCTATHFTGPYLDMPSFWQDEVVARAPLLNLNYGFLEAHKDTLRPRLLRWVARASFYAGPVRYVAIDDEDEDVVRVIIKDAERTFFAAPHRAKLVALLHAMYHEFGAYGQAMSYLAALCMLALSDEETAAVLRFVATEYIKGHWAAEAVGFATSAWVVEYFLAQRAPDVAAHLQSLRLWPDTYLQKILTGLCVHVLRFRELFDFLDAFMQDGMRYLTRFCLAIVDHFRSDLLAVTSAQDTSTVYDIMRLDARVADQHDIRAILDRVATIDLGDDGDALDVIRSRVYSEKVEPRLQRAPKTEAYEPCEHCGTRRPTWWHDDTGAICTTCKDACDAALVFEKY